jgi:xylulokinase
MNGRIIAYDLGTGGIKASLYDLDGKSHDSVFKAYETSYPERNFHEQAPLQWWNAIISCTHKLINSTGTDPEMVHALAISGHSLGTIPIDDKGNLLVEKTPIWSDSRAVDQAKEFFSRIDCDSWYLTTGNGFPPECYTVFKTMWYRDNMPDMFTKTYKILGSKDYCNYLLTGKIFTDHSYASGSGVYDLKSNCYRDDFIKASGLDAELFPEIIKSHDKVGNLLPSAAKALGLTTNTTVICGGVDNSCMALGARGFKPGRAYTSLGSSSWIAVIDDKPIIDAKTKPFVFSHVVDGLYTSATSIFAAGSSLRWVRDNILSDLAEKEKSGEIDNVYELMDRMAEQSPIGANCLIFNPSLAGGAMIEESKNICGGYIGLSLRHDRHDLVRSAYEGISYNLNYAFQILLSHCNDINELLVVGGGSKSKFWRQMYADIFGIRIIKTNIDQDCASLGAAALAAYGMGYWKNYDVIDNLHNSSDYSEPCIQNHNDYNKYYMLHRTFAHYLALSGDRIQSLMNEK